MGADVDCFGERRGRSYPEQWWQAVRLLYEEAFPGLPTAIDRARWLGACWDDVSTPFALFAAGRCVCHVGVITHPLLLRGREVPVAGIHAVCTATAWRRRGLARQTLSRALAWADRTHPVAKLHTDEPRVYAGHGFRPIPTWRFLSAAPPAGSVAKRLLRPSTDPDDAALLADRLARRTAVSHHLGTADSGWMVTIVAALSGRLDRALWWLPDHQAVVAFDEEDGHTLVAEVIAQRLPPAAVIRGAAPHPQQPMYWTFHPDRVEPGAEPVPAPAGVGSFMVRGAWPAGLAPFGISPLWEH